VSAPETTTLDALAKLDALITAREAEQMTALEALMPSPLEDRMAQMLTVGYSPREIARAVQGAGLEPPVRNRRRRQPPSGAR
jgi:hypothetical protein